MGKFASKGLIIPTGMVLAALAVLIWLGTWQMQRRDWKLGLIHEIETRAKAPSITLEKARNIQRDTSDINHYRVRLKGSFEHDKERHLYTVENGRAGWRIFTPLKVATGGILFVDRGYVPENLKDRATRRESLLQGQVKITGLARPPTIKRYFMPENNTVKNEFFWRSLSEMASTAYPGETPDLVPFFLEVETISPQGGLWPKPGIPRLTILNKHLEYALTWYALAIVLIVIYAIFVRGRLRESE